MQAATERAILQYCRLVGWSVAAAMLAAAAALVLYEVRDEKLRSHASKHDFLVRVRACVHGQGLPWETCERLVNAFQ